MLHGFLFGIGLILAFALFPYLMQAAVWLFVLAVGLVAAALVLAFVFNAPLAAFSIFGLIVFGVVMHKLSERWEEERRRQRALEQVPERLEYDLRDAGYHLRNANDAQPHETSPVDLDTELHELISKKIKGEDNGAGLA